MLAKALRYILLTVFLVLLCFGAGFFYLISTYQPKADMSSFKEVFVAQRIVDTPIIYSELHPKLIEESALYGYSNINGPSLIRVPDWIQNPLGKYYLYFAHHKGRFLRLAYADSLAGPWKMYDKEIMPLSESGFATEDQAPQGTLESLKTLQKHTQYMEFAAMLKIGTEAAKAQKARTGSGLKTSSTTKAHVASPDVLIDEENRNIRLYFHGLEEGRVQLSRVALSDDGLQFEALPDPIGLPYMRIFKHQQKYYGFAMPGILYESDDGLRGFRPRRRWIFDTYARHSAVWKQDDALFVFYTVVGDSPERIFYAKMDLQSPNWNRWNIGISKELLRPELEWEGALEPLQASRRGEVGIRVNQLRDPYVFEDIDKKLYLLYAGAGEQALGLATLELQNLQ